MILMSDFYKQAHAEQYPEGVTKLISYATARMSRLPEYMGGDKLTVFGIQSFVKDFLIERFNDTFFNVPLEEAMAEYNTIIGETFPIQYVNTGKFEALHKLGYLPVEVGCLPEGTRVPIRSAFNLPENQCQVPFMYIVNTHPDFPWITEFLESVTSSEIWYPMAIANQAYYYRQIVNKWYGVTGCDDSARKSAISEFGFRGGEGSSAATLASAAFLTSFNKTATIPAIKYLHEYYGDDYKDIASGMISTEHSVMCSNYAVDSAKGGDESTFLNKLFTEIYPGGALSVVMDTYYYWANLASCGKGKLREAILNRQGTVFFRGDSGDPVDIICGYKTKQYKSMDEMKNTGDDMTLGEVVYIEDEDKYYRINMTSDFGAEWIAYDDKPVDVMGTVELLWEMFGGTVNESGYKVLDSHVRAIYGDSITPTRADEMYRRLAEKGFASCNVALGAGSFSTQCAETKDGELYPFTRDSYEIAVKATWCQDNNGEERQLFKNPKTDTGKFKKSQKGLIYVTTDENGEIIARDRYTTETIPKEGNLLQPIFRDGKMLSVVSLDDVRQRLHNGQF
jgi:nicotinamide phosphoribosyltransferase